MLPCRLLQQALLSDKKLNYLAIGYCGKELHIADYNYSGSKLIAFNLVLEECLNDDGSLLIEEGIF